MAVFQGNPIFDDVAESESSSSDDVDNAASDYQDKDGFAFWLVRPWCSRDRNIIMDNFFTCVQLAEDLLAKKRQL
ncbi:hypothetical protein T4D_7056 [Trichinella pseudospiralis]|uniref:PiggyBac transposable element-derived protein domain-containing protein n=1 Tax=Trichinella pseudospiralis TaxID=6337 RepID=A0A0V1F6P4_TRIPS|nr:hypothetical protein T4D_7056 [Trichinella pseudospiralis]